jgi:DNA-binding transcriptional ArsR family regulator
MGVNNGKAGRRGDPGGRFWVPDRIADEWAAKVGPVGFAVYTMLARHAGRDGTCFPSYGTLARKLGMSRRHVMTLVGQLEANGLLAVERQGGRRNVYRLAGLARGGEAQFTPGVKPSSPRGEAQFTPHIKGSTSKEAPGKEVTPPSPQGGTGERNGHQKDREARPRRVRRRDRERLEQDERQRERWRREAEERRRLEREKPALPLREVARQLKESLRS